MVHPDTAGTCSLLPREKNGVVDTHLKVKWQEYIHQRFLMPCRFQVYGTDNIRVVDMSIIPLHFAAHPQGT